MEDELKDFVFEMWKYFLEILQTFLQWLKYPRNDMKTY